MVYGAMSRVPVVERPCDWAHVDTRGLGRAVSHLRQGRSRMGASSFSGAGEPQGTGRYEAKALRQEPVVLADHLGGVDRSLGLWFGLATDPRCPGQSIPKRFKDFLASGCSVTCDLASGEPRHTWDLLGGETYLRLSRPVSRWLSVRTTPTCPPVVSASASSGSCCRSTALAMPPASSPSRLACRTCGCRADWSRLKRFGTVAMRCDSFGAAAPSGRLLRSESCSTRTTREEEERAHSK